MAMLVDISAFFLPTQRVYLAHLAQLITYCLKVCDNEQDYI